MAREWRSTNESTSEGQGGKTSCDLGLVHGAGDGVQLTKAYDSGSWVSDEYARKWAATRPHRQTTATRVESLISKHIEGATVGDKRLSPAAPLKSRLGLQTEPKSCPRPPCGSWCRLCAQCSMPPSKIA